LRVYAYVGKDVTLDSVQKALTSIYGNAKIGKDFVEFYNDGNLKRYYLLRLERRIEGFPSFSSYPIMCIIPNSEVESIEVFIQLIGNFGGYVEVKGSKMLLVKRGK
jgi:hypothetical protein